MQKPLILTLFTHTVSHYQLIATIREVVLRDTNALTQVHTHLSSLILEQFLYMVSCNSMHRLLSPLTLKTRAS